MSNPLFNEDLWNQSGTSTDSVTVNGTVLKTGILLLVVLMLFGMTWDSLARTGLAFTFQPFPAMVIAGISSFILVLIAGFIPHSAPVTGSLYAAFKGVLLGSGGWLMNQNPSFEGLPLLAATMTIGTLAGMLFLYAKGIIRATPFFKKVVISATIGLAVGLGILWLFTFLGVGTGIMAALIGSGPFGIGLSIFCVGLAAFNLILDFDFIENAVAKRLPKYFEWVGALGLLVTLLWLYIEFLRLLNKLNKLRQR